MGRDAIGITIFIVACNDVQLDQEEHRDISVEDQQWKLVRMTGSTMNSETTGADMEWQETYSLSEDGTFIKTRVVDGSTFQALGTYQVIDLSDGTYFEFSYNQQSSIIGNCTGDLIELLSFRDNSLIGTWWACDGPGLEYLRE